MREGEVSQRLLLELSSFKKFRNGVYYTSDLTIEDCLLISNPLNAMKME